MVVKTFGLFVLSFIKNELSMMYIQTMWCQGMWSSGQLFQCRHHKLG